MPHRFEEAALTPGISNGRLDLGISISLPGNGSERAKTSESKHFRAGHLDGQFHFRRW